MKCRVCEAADTRLVEEIRFFDDFSAPVFDCGSCGSRFAECRPELYEKFHATNSHYYAQRMREFTDAAAALFKKGDVGGLRKQIGRSHFAGPLVADEFEKANAKSIVEIGCAWGYVSSYFILKGFDCLGVDISETAIQHAREAFGDHFCLVNDPRYLERTHLDGIFHLGTIGCVEKPIELTRQLMDKLKPGGVLVFNAPTLSACEELDIPWLWGACPPDLVTVFRNDFWERTFGKEAEVQVTSRPLDAVMSMRIRKARRRGERQPRRGGLFTPSGIRHIPMKAQLRRVAATIAAPFVKPLIHPFGVVVRMRKR